MGSLNKVLLIGNLGRDAELRYTPGGTAVSKFSMATTETWNDKAGERQERTEWHYCTIWGKQAESLTEYLTKGKQVYVEGKLQTSEYTDKEGIERKSTGIRVDRLVLLGGGGGGADRGSQQPRGRSRQGGRNQPQAGVDDRTLDDDALPPDAPLTDDDIPF